MSQIQKEPQKESQKQSRQNRRAYLDAMGIEQWCRRGFSQQVDIERTDDAETVQALQAQPKVDPDYIELGKTVEQGTVEHDTVVQNSAVQDTIVLDKNGLTTASVSTLEHPVLQLPDADRIAIYSWEQLQGAVKQCVACDLHKTRKNTVFGVGDSQADWMVIGEAPGADEDRLGEPFVGRAGQLLNNMLLAIGLKREQVFIANILKCRPPNNRDPRPEEVVKCEPFLKRQVELVDPKIILAVGRIAAHNLLKTDSSLSSLRGRCFYYGDQETPVVITYHPAYLLRSPREKRKAWQDLLFAKSIADKHN